MPAQVRHYSIGGARENGSVSCALPPPLSATILHNNCSVDLSKSQQTKTITMSGTSNVGSSHVYEAGDQVRGDHGISAMIDTDNDCRGTSPTLSSSSRRKRSASTRARATHTLPTTLVRRTDLSHVKDVANYHLTEDERSIANRLAHAEKDGLDNESGKDLSKEDKLSQKDATAPVSVPNGGLKCRMY